MTTRPQHTYTHELAQAREAERVALCATLHDELQPLLLAVKVKLAVLGRQSSSPPTLLMEADGLLAQALDACRSLTTELSALDLSAGGLIPALELLVEQYRRRFGVEVKALLPQQNLRWPAEVEMPLFAAIRELLLNSVKHSKSQRVELTFVASRGSTTVRVWDRGVGGKEMKDENAAIATRGTGLERVRQAIRALGGVFVVQGKNAEGWCAIIHLPQRGVAAARP